MPNQINSTNTPKKYDASDMHDLASLSESDMNWMCTAISHIRKEVMKLNKLAESGKEVSQYHFSELVTHLDMYEYLAEDRHRNHAKGAEAYKTEWEKMKGGSHNA
ncbi:MULTISPECIES: hypothetical protein [Acinetobacter]|uniref:hypothetical protein n=1 Tax=Acinetobacter TaxID=469 RepID=UPI0015B7B5CF|nr:MULTISPECIES: hypothetical protein [Acinetobacter]MCF7642939.1 hypothetical protein [Acinetobacter johnsonii]NWK59954.1 hypothetical protein [Acinetobacter sp. SwsAc2]NWK63337.1 hypothetical protein [Acinetobacter sp. SwsAc3]